MRRRRKKVNRLGRNIGHVGRRTISNGTASPISRLTTAYENLEVFFFGTIGKGPL